MSRLCVLGMVMFLASNSASAFDVRVSNSSADSRDVVIQGDGDHNSIRIEQVRANVIRVTGRTRYGVFPTLINGSTRPVEITVTDDLFISMGGGNDRVTILDLNLTNQTHSDLNVRMDSGSDRLDFDFVFVSRNVSIDFGSGNDDLYSLGPTTAANLNIVGGEGADAIAVESCGLGSLNVFAGNGNDSVWIAHNEVGTLVISMEAGSDDLTIYGNRASNVDLFGGSGTDELWTRITAWNSFNAGANSTSFEHHLVFP